ncbi:mannose-1-phosphate guanylyltransferase/mannose-6-phosphate isomerase [Arenicella sp. 4NH20-0111]|uniref:mannose-1-phosphate guanylyltransferase/mannose-6-phosphate isomerase n=1 Tax=Arenicella sp. 4NH20-0111 TaxID=3127648 RepID=UPI00310A417B
MIPVVLSGGVGSRLWPLSRGMYPKQLLPLVDDGVSMLQQTVLRAQGIDSVKAPIIVCNEEHRFMVGEQLNQVGVDQARIILEPEGRNTAPAIALAAFAAAIDDPDEVLLVMPADHVVLDGAAFKQAVEKAMLIAAKGDLVTFGIVPSSPETGYGYIRSGESSQDGAFTVADFKEKPDQATAQRYLDEGGYYWNGGIFVFTASAYLTELKKFAPDVYEAAESAMVGQRDDLDFIRINEDAFSESPNISVDYAVMEKTSKAKVIPLNAGWSDVGSWAALWEVSEKDSNGNALIGDVLTHDTTNTHIYSESKLVSAVGVDDLVIVETADAVMVANKGDSQNVKEIVKKLKSENRSQVSHHRKVYRPWGWYDSVDSGDRFQVKRIQVKPGARLSVQMHYHRAEHWVVVKGTAEVLNGNETILLRENESTFIPIGTTHALRNPSESQPLEIIEVQSGSYLGEDDIVRIEDNYGRAGSTK